MMVANSPLSSFARKASFKLFQGTVISLTILTAIGALLGLFYFWGPIPFTRYAKGYDAEKFDSLKVGDSVHHILSELGYPLCLSYWHENNFIQNDGEIDQSEINTWLSKVPADKKVYFSYSRPVDHSNLDIPNMHYYSVYFITVNGIVTHKKRGIYFD